MTANPRTTRLYTQGVQAAVHTKEGAAPVAFGDVSTQTLASAIDRNLDDMQGAEPSALTIADPELINLQELTRGWLSPRKLGKLAGRVVPALIASGLTAAVCWFVWAREAPRPVVTMPVATAAPAPSEPAPVAAPGSSPRAAAAAPAPATAPVAAAPAPAAAAGEALCRARISSRPSGATVTIGQRRVGTTPVDSGELPCQTTFTLSRPRYSVATATLAAGQDSVLVKLNRPAAELALTSRPANAEFKVNRAPAGQAPRTVSVSRFESVQIEATLPGHRKWRKTLYVSSPNMKIEAVLTPGR